MNNTTRREIQLSLEHAASDKQRGELVKDILASVLGEMYGEMLQGHENPATCNIELYVSVEDGVAKLSRERGEYFCDLESCISVPDPGDGESDFAVYVTTWRWNGSVTEHVCDDYLPGCQRRSLVGEITNGSSSSQQDDRDFDAIFESLTIDWDDYADRYAQAFQSLMRPLIESWEEGGEA